MWGERRCILAMVLLLQKSILFLVLKPSNVNLLATSRPGITARYSSMLHVRLVQCRSVRNDQHACPQCSPEIVYDPVSPHQDDICCC